MTRAHYLQRLQEIQDDVLVLGTMVSRAVERSTESLRNYDVPLARQVIAEDKPINAKRFAIEDDVIHLIATQGPMAVDLRALIAVLSIVTDLERMGDHAEGNSRIAIMLSELDERPEQDEHIWQLSELAIVMLERGLQSYVNHDAEAAHAICDQDDDADRLYDEHYRVIHERMIRGGQSLITPLTYRLWAAHNLERVCDRVTNICERVIFLVTGKMEEINVSKY